VTLTLGPDSDELPVEKSSIAKFQLALDICELGGEKGNILSLRNSKNPITADRHKKWMA